MWTRLRDHLPALVLALVALHQLAATRYGDLSPWLGGGFGMFAVVDSPGNRQVSILTQEPGLRRELSVPPHLELLAERVAAFPLQSRVDALADRIAQDLSRGTPPPAAVEITVWKAWPEAHPLRSARATVTAERP